ncbi:MAG: helix-turn-helix domain-containing protein [Rhodocyclaceae bacterium]|jgi:Fis family transcriptional regulator|nr:helix-turn-helix domain-containing protein [Rhodocyclaceae bacterium]MDO9602800.1 helix-turn-helix domain-containing protein [Rhodocyclaceae bacterium]MDP2196595.1 helix-turn-helix domain-containing protein [Rhodocyclaceae bacterium]MDP3038227.1 helix-turn-helix domain-containing protein [Rhodocyclaceae bacterium]
MSNELADCIRRNLNRYFRDLDGESPHAIYDMVIGSVEKPMLEVVMKQAQHNQTVAAAMLGISRSTLRRKLAEHNIS